MSNEKGTLQLVKSIKEGLNKELPLKENEDEASIERCRDLLDRLAECSMTLDILSETLIGKVVSSFKTHPVLGVKAKAMIKTWKKIAKDSAKEESGPPSTSAKPDAPPPAKKTTPAGNKLNRVSSTASSSSAVSANAHSEWAGLLPMRQNICKKFYELFLSSREALVQDGINADAIDMLLAPRAAEVETALWTTHANDKKAYADKSRTLVFNLRKNTPLTQGVILGQVPSETLVKLKSEELASAETRKAQANEAQKVLDAKRLDWEQANESKINEMCGIKGDLLSASLFTCGRCKSTKTTSSQKQTRSADEPMTVFVLCLNCGKRWKC